VSGIFITGSSDGLGMEAAQLLIQKGHQIVLEARSLDRADQIFRTLPQADAVVVGDLMSIAWTRRIAEQVNGLGAFDAAIHNAGVGYREPKRIAPDDGLPHVPAVNTIAPYILTALISRAQRLVRLSSIFDQKGDPSLKDLTCRKRSGQGEQAYTDTKLPDVLLDFAVARCWPGVLSNALEPGLARTKMGGAGATDDLDEAHRTQV
jgi:NAD(P)-dependent dehydrogenase (short-subunit alcohol dehydrogenase family)